MLDMSDIVTDPDFSYSWTITRSQGYFGQGGFQNTTTVLQAYGVVTVASEEDLQMVPEGDRVTGMMSFYWPYQIYRTHNEGTSSQGISDIITWQGVNYRVITVRPPIGNFYKAICTRMSGE